MRKLQISKRLTNSETHSFKTYLKEVSKIPLLTSKEENDLAIKVSNGDEEAKNELVSKNLRFVISVAKKYETPNILLEDLVNEGNIGLILAADNFKPDMGFKFISYGVWWIRKMILEYMVKHSRLVRLPANQLSNLSKLDKSISELEQKNGRNIDLSELVTEYCNDFSEKDFKLLKLIKSYNVKSLDHQLNNNYEDLTLIDILPNNSEPTDLLTNNEDYKVEVNRLISTLRPKDQFILKHIYGLNNSTPLTLTEIASEFDITTEAVRKIKDKLLLKLSKKMLFLKNNIC